jgi:hypothetical protein
VPLLLLPLTLLESRRRGRSLGLLSLLGAGLALAALAEVRYGTLGGSLGGSISRQINELSSISLPFRVTQLGLAQRPATLLVGLAFVAAYVWLLREAWHGRARLGLCACLLLLALPWLQPWYALWAVPLAAVEEDTLARLAALALSAYFLRDALPI